MSTNTIDHTTTLLSLLVSSAWNFLNAIEISQSRIGLQPLTRPHFTMLEAQLVLATTNALLCNHRQEPGISAGLHFLFPYATCIADVDTAELQRAINIIQMQMRSMSPFFVVKMEEEENATSQKSSEAPEAFESRKKIRK